MMYAYRSSLIMGLAIFAASAALPAIAQTPLAMAFSSASVRDDNPGSVSDSGPRGAATFVAAQSQYGMANASASATAGAIGAGTFTQSAPQSAVVNNSVAQANASYHDSLIVTSTLPVGTPVTVRFVKTLTGALRTNATFSDAGFASILGGFRAVGNFGGVTLNFDINTLSGIILDDKQGDYNTCVGDTIALDYSLSSQAQANLPSIFAASDYFNTLHVYADPRIPDVTLVAASGHDYSISASAPEPNSVALLIGVVFLGGSSLLRRRTAFTAQSRA